jgi:NitT/TauT family transport system ATP-binding protein
MRVRVESLSKVYPAPSGRRLVALEDISLDVADGEFVTILGPSGCGKSTLLQVVAGLEAPTRGRVIFESPPPDAPLTAGRVPGARPLPVANGAGERDVRARGPRACPRPSASRRRGGCSRWSGSRRSPTGTLTTCPAACASAWRSRRALAVEPALLLMDEPFSALDAQSRALLQLELLSLWERTRRSILYVTHQIQEAVLLGDRVVVMTRRPGRILAVRPGAASAAPGRAHDARPRLRGPGRRVLAADQAGRAGGDGRCPVTGARPSSTRDMPAAPRDARLAPRRRRASGC